MSDESQLSVAAAQRITPQPITTNSPSPSLEPPFSTSGNESSTPDLFGPLGLDLDNCCDSCGAPDVTAPYCEECS